MTYRTLIIATAVAALGSPLTAGDQSVEKAERFRAVTSEIAEPVTLPQAVSHDATKGPAVLEQQVEELGASVENDSSAQIEELGCCYNWNVNAAQVEELGPYYWNESAEQVEELGPFYWNNNAEQVEELGCCYIWNQ